jgi:hypothetical protein
MSSFIPLPRDELKKLFIENYDIENDFKIKNIGIPIFNSNDSSCFFISALNLIARMQYVIFNEINNLIEYPEIIALNDKISNDECLTNEEVKNFNKYLLIQTIIELINSSNSIKNMQLIKSRLDSYLFIKNEFTFDANQNNMFMSIVDKIHDYYKFFISNPEYENISKQIKTYSQDLISQYYTLYALNDYPVINENFYNPTLDILNQIAEKLRSIDLTTLPSNLIRIEDLDRMMNRLNQDDKFTEEDFDTIEAVFTDTRCSNMKLKEFEKNISLINIFGLKSEDINGGNDPNIILKILLSTITEPTNYRIINDDNLSNVKTSLTDCTEPYVFINLKFDMSNLIVGPINKVEPPKSTISRQTSTIARPPRPQIISPINLFKNVNNYDLGGILYICNTGVGGHSVVSLNYVSDSINSREHTLINDDSKYPLNLKITYLYESSEKGKNCTNKIEPNQLLYESARFINILKEQMNNFIREYNSTSSAGSLSTSSSTAGSIGGAVLNDKNNYYKNKYLKYKSKYLNLLNKNK